MRNTNEAGVAIHTNRTALHVEIELTALTKDELSDLAACVLSGLPDDESLEIFVDWAQNSGVVPDAIAALEESE